MEKEKTNWLKIYFNPGFVLMSVMIGGGFATGREIVQYGGRFGAKGWVVGLCIAIVFSLIAMVLFEIARLYKRYDYRSHIKVYGGPLAYVFDITNLVLAILVMSVMSSAIGNVFQQTIGLPYMAGVIIIVIVAAVVGYWGKALLEKVEVWGAIIMYVSYIIFAILAIRGRTDNIARVFAEGDTSYLDPGTNTGFFAILWIAVLYAGYNLQPFTTTLFTLKSQTTRKQALLSGAIAGFIIIIPWALSYLAMMAYYPSEEVFSATIPWLVMMEGVSKPVVVIFTIVVSWTLIATACGVINSIADRFDQQFVEMGRKPLTQKGRLGITLIYLVGAILLSRIGIIALIDKGYGTMSILCMISFGIPLLTVGTYKILTFKPGDENKNLGMKDQKEV